MYDWYATGETYAGAISAAEEAQPASAALSATIPKFRIFENPQSRYHPSATVGGEQARRPTGAPGKEMEFQRIWIDAGEALAVTSA